MRNKISVITVVFNNVSEIRQTMESFFSQTWEDKEYIVVDGGSTDGTVDIIKEYADRLAFFCSEKDNGLYDAMNKGISHCTGDWIIVLNSGDLFCDGKSLERAMTLCNPDDCDIIYGHSVMLKGDEKVLMPVPDNVRGLDYGPVYRHCSSLVRTSVHREFLFDLSKIRYYEFALDIDVMYRMYKTGKRFQRVDTVIEMFKQEGVSYRPVKNAILDFRVTTSDGNTIPKTLVFVKNLVMAVLTNSKLYKCFLRPIIKYGK